MIKEFHESKNLLNINDISPEYHCTINISDDAIAQTNTGSYARTSVTISNLSLNKSYTFKTLFNNPNGATIQARVYDANNNQLSPRSVETNVQSGELTFTFTPPTTAVIIKLYSNTLSTSDTNTVTFSNVMLNEGDTALPYEPYFTPVWKSVSYAKSISGAQTYTKFPIVLRTTEQSIPTWSVKGNEEHTGTPTPSNPVEVNGVGNATSNVMPYATAQTISDNGITVTSDGQGTYHVEGLATADTNISLTIPEFTIPVSVGSGGQGTMALFNGQIGSSQGNSRLEFYNGSTRVDSWQLIQANRTSTTYGALMDGKNCNKINIFIKSGVSANADIKPMFTNDGTLPTVYEPYGYKIPISSGGVTTNIYLGSTQTVRAIKKYVITGDENWTSAGGGAFYALSISPYMTDRNDLMCSHFFVGNYSGALVIGQLRGGGTPSNTILFNYDNGAIGVDGFKSWLAAQYANGTPVTLWYVLATPETGTVNEPLMKIGDYADALSNAASIPTTSGLNTIDVATTLKPSEMSITYDGYKLCKGQRYSRTENLWNEDYTGISSDVIYKPVYVGDGTFTLSTTCPRSSDPAPCLFFLSGNVDSGASSAVNGVWNEHNGIQNSQNGYVTIAYRKLGMTNPENYDTMLNEGSTAKPYQPYLDWE